MLPATTRTARAALEADRARDPRARRLRADRDARRSRPRELFARGVGESTDVVQKEMYTLHDGDGDQLTLRPEGTAPVCRAYLEHGMHKLPQPVKLWYLSSFFRRERPQNGRFRQFWQIGAEAIGSDDPAVDAEIDPAAGRAARGARRARACGCAWRSLGTPESRAAYRDELQALPARARGPSCPQEVRGAHRPQPAARVRRRPPPARSASWPTAPLLIDRLAADDREHFEARPGRCSTPPGVAYEVDPTLVRGLDYYTRTLFEFTSDALGAQTGVGGGGRYDGLIEQIGGAADARHGLGRRRRADAARLAARRPSRRRRGPLRRLRQARARARRRSGSPPTRAAPGTRRDSNSPGAR